MTDLNNPETIEIHGLRTIHKLCKFGADYNMEGCTFTEIVERLFAELEKAKAQAVPEHIITLQRNGEVFKFDLLDLLRRSLKSSKVLKTRENWSHVSKMVGIGSTTATLLCKEMNVDPDGTLFVASESGAEK